MAIITITADQFRADFTEFSDVNKYSDESLGIFINRAYCYISRSTYGKLPQDVRTLAIELMVAHLLTIQDKINSNSASGQIASTSIDAISVSLVAPINRNAWQYWLNSTPYGMELLALLQAHSSAGLYYGGSFQRVFR
jgi:hypothetical protein